jgi:hypothetical protein
LGIGDWGLGIGDWGLGIGPNPQSPIPNPQNVFLIIIFIKIIQIVNINKLVIFNITEKMDNNDDDYYE